MMHPTTQLAHAALRQAERQHTARLARTRLDLLAHRRARRTADLTARAALLRGTLSRRAVSPPVCCTA